MAGENTSPQLFVPVTPWHGADRLILDVPERQVLISFERDCMEEHQILICSKSGRRWLVGAGSYGHGALHPRGGGANVRQGGGGQGWRRVEV